MTQTPVVVVGGGAAGMMAALAARRAGAAVVLLEPNEKLGRKLYITGKGRCNLTNNTTPEGVLAHVTRNGRFLYSAVTRFPPAAVMEYFEALGVPLKTERGGRVFPCSDRAADVIDALFFALKKEGVVLRRGKAEELRLAQGRVVGVSLGEESLPAGAVILATGGLSYPATGSTGDGYRLAQSAGHTIVPPTPSLVPLEEAGDTCAQMQGLSLKNVTLTLKNQKKKVVFQEQGEMLFTHFGLSGPLVLSASAHANWSRDTYTAVLDLKPALEEEKLEARKLTVVPSLPEGETYVYADGRHLWRVIDNLLGNCAKYAMEGTRIYLELVRGKGQVTLSIKNISRDPLNVPPERLMERFVRGDESRTTEGSGLGLSIARSLTELQGGTFELAVDGDLFKATVTMPQSG